MSLEQLSKTVDFVQDATPSNANDGETYLDTSLSPPRLKVFDSSANAFVKPRSVQNLDAKVSNVGVDWSSKTPKSSTSSDVSVGDFETATLVSVSGAGYVTRAVVRGSKDSQFFTGNLVIDGTRLVTKNMNADVNRGVGERSTGSQTTDTMVTYEGIIRFDSSFRIELESTDRNAIVGAGEVEYVLD